MYIQNNTRRIFGSGARTLDLLLKQCAIEQTNMVYIDKTHAVYNMNDDDDDDDML
jgi:hypothetical protein